jgi:hypothetical protein
MEYELTKEQSEEIDRLEAEACEREEFVEKMLACSDYTLEQIVEWTDEDYVIGASFEGNLDEFERWTERDARTGKESATVVETVITHILKEKRIKKDEIHAKAKKDGVKPVPRIPKEWFNNLISETCLKHDISEGHIRLVGCWNINEDIDEKDVEE